MTEVTVRDAELGDVARIVQFVRDLALFEKEPESARGSEADFRAALFPTEGAPTAYALIGEIDGAPAGMALWYLTFSTWEGRPGIHLEDLYVDPAARGSGLGGALLRRLAAICMERDYRRLEWSVLRWNTPAIDFYDALGATPQDDWLGYRLDGDALTRVGHQRPRGD